ncbi:hypothetical protein KC19_VG171400 [Ceratodon purpureus]|uniref:Uncharacterized protein n=1 Tax=Ceratodon purpureus TaxID=3225 RepID=A0A8T0HRG1_CERPU|nr:hypothetical protein KC19_VG171400 [Ceratodon purpureus]
MKSGTAPAQMENSDIYNNANSKEQQHIIDRSDDNLGKHTTPNAPADIMDIVIIESPKETTDDEVGVECETSVKVVGLKKQESNTSVMRSTDAAGGGRLANVLEDTGGDQYSFAEENTAVGIKQLMVLPSRTSEDFGLDAFPDEEETATKVNIPNKFEDTCTCVFHNPPSLKNTVQHQAAFVGEAAISESNGISDDEDSDSDSCCPTCQWQGVWRG